MKVNDVLKVVNLDVGKNEVNLDNFYSIGKISSKNPVTVQYFVGLKETFLESGLVHANKLIIESNTKQEVKIHLGKGYLIDRDDSFTNKFQHYDKWSGGDGIYTFNIETGNDSFDQEIKGKTLLVFGDTFYGHCDQKTHRRYEPLLMPNNSLAYYEPKTDEIEFRINREPLTKSVTAFFNLDRDLDMTGTVERDLVSYNRNSDQMPWMSAYDLEEDITIILDLHKSQYVTHLVLESYFSLESKSLAKRSINQVKVLVSNQLDNWIDLGIKKVDVEIKIEKEVRYIKLIVIKEEKVEDTYALNKIYIYNGTHQYKDIKVKASSVFFQKQANSWLWLQDGVVIGDKLYFLPMIIASDLTQPEGLQFALKDVILVSVPIENGEISYQKSKQKMAPIIADRGHINYLMGGAIMPHTKNSGALNGDGYIYIYGFKTTYGFRDVVVARVKEDEFEYFDAWRYYNGQEWVPEILEAATIFSHCSCEFSVSEIKKGAYKGKFIAFYTYEVNTRYLAYSIGESPHGPFTKPIIYYQTPEYDKFKSTTYTYNSKAHPHLSNSDDILVSYNTNTYSFEHNMADCRVYKPRFVRLKEILE